MDLGPEKRENGPVYIAPSVAFADRCRALRMEIMRALEATRSHSAVQASQMRS